MKKYYLLRRDKECRVAEKNLTVWSDVFDEVGDRIEISSRECRKDFKNIIAAHRRKIPPPSLGKN